MKMGKAVAVCHDGKWGRRVRGEVVATRRGHHIRVRFPHPETEELVEFWARKRSHIRYCRRKPNTCIVYGKRYGGWGGWADIDWFCPWYAVYPWPKGEPAADAKGKENG